MNNNIFDDLVFNWIQSLNLNCTDKWIINCLYKKIGIYPYVLNDKMFNACCSTNFQNVRREIRRFSAQKILKVEYDIYRNRIITILVPKYIKKTANTYYSKKNICLIFQGRLTEEIIKKVKKSNLILGATL
jgi:hypothetical protein